MEDRKQDAVQMQVQLLYPKSQWELDWPAGSHAPCNKAFPNSSHSQADAEQKLFQI
jgi:hypothetical protein